MPKAAALALAVALLAAACGDAAAPSTTAPATSAPSTTATAPPATGQPEPATTTTLVAQPAPGLPAIELETVATGLTRPTYLTAPPGDPRLFVTEKDTGRILIVADGEVLPEPFLDLGERLVANEELDERGRSERGLLTMAFHPDYAANGRFFVYYADRSGISELVEYRVSGDPNRADPASGIVLREYGPTIRHYGGTLAFGPDGYLWLSIGEGGNRRAAPDVTTPRGGILRFDVTTPGQADGAPDNPWTDEGGSPDLWAKGLRNPWRWSIDPATGLLYLGDVGHEDMEEINVQPAAAAGLDYGWPVVEGTLCVRSETCDPAGTVVPVEEMPHPVACSVIGGYVYRGAAIPDLVGTYFHSDFCGGWLRSFRIEEGAAVEQHQWIEQVGPVTSFGLDGFGELYLVTIDGVIRKVVPAA